VETTTIDHEGPHMNDPSEEPLADWEHELLNPGNCPRHPTPGAVNHAAQCTCWARCSCDVIDISTMAEVARGEYNYVRGKPNDCPIHATPAEQATYAARREAMREHDERRAAAERRARMAP